MTKTSMQLCALTLTIAIGLSVSATASLIAGDTDANMPAEKAPVITNDSGKDDRLTVSSKIEPLNVRCVAMDRTTTCTGWPTAEGVVVGSL